VSAAACTTAHFFAALSGPSPKGTAGPFGEEVFLLGALLPWLSVAGFEILLTFLACNPPKFRTPPPPKSGKTFIFGPPKNPF